MYNSSMPYKILIIKYGALGDVIRSAYILPGIKKKYPESHITWITAESAVDLLKYNIYIDNLLTDKNKNNLIGQEFDWIISLEDEPFHFKIASKIKYKKISGAYEKDSKMNYTEDMSLWFDMGLISKFGKEKADELKKNNNLSHSEIFAKSLAIEIAFPVFFNDPKVEEQISNKFKNTQNKIGLNLSSGKRWISKSLKESEAIKLINKLLNQDIIIYLLGGLDDLEYNTSIKNIFMNNPSVILFEPMSLLEFAAVIKNMNCLISADTMALHLAIAQKVKNISFYAPTSAVEIEVFGFGEKVISTSGDYCSYKKEADNSSITADRIYDKLMKLTNKGA